MVQTINYYALVIIFGPKSVSFNQLLYAVDAGP